MITGNKDDLLIFSCHHKVGTSWFSNILSHMANEFDLKFEYNQELFLSKDTDVFFDDHSRLDLSNINNYKGVHLIRDPRDVIVSGYHYHKWTDEVWANTCAAKYDGKTYRTKINSFQNTEEGILFEMENVGAETINEMMQWDYSNPNFLEIKFEDLLSNPKKVFQNIFSHYGFTGSSLDKCLTIADEYTFEKLKKKVNSKHLRKGQAGDWRNYFSENIKIAFKNKFPVVLEKLGYENDSNW